MSLDDFAQLARAHASVWQAQAFRRAPGLGQRERIDVVVMAAGGGTPSPALKVELRDTLRAHALPSVAISISDYQRVTFRLRVTIRVRSAAFDRQSVSDALAGALRAAFNEETRRLGAPLFRGAVYAAVDAVAGVDNSDCHIDIDAASRALRRRRRARRRGDARAAGRRPVPGARRGPSRDHRRGDPAMSSQSRFPAAQFGELLRAWLPAHWRERDAYDGRDAHDGRGDLGALLAVYGELLDALQASVMQRACDVFADSDATATGDAPGRNCQAWLLPYITQLVDTRLVSPDEAGRRAEISEAVAWRQRKGTRVAVEAIAKRSARSRSKCTRLETRRHDAARRPPVAARVGVRRSRAARPTRHRRSARATPVCRRRRSTCATPSARCAASRQRRRATDQLWRRAPGLARGQPACAAVRAGKLPGLEPAHRRPARPSARAVSTIRAACCCICRHPKAFARRTRRRSNWNEVIGRATYDGPHLRVTTARIEWNGQTLPLVSFVGVGAEPPVRLRGLAHFTQRAVYRFENVWLDNRVQVDDGAVQLHNCAVRQLRVLTAERDVPVIDARLPRQAPREGMEAQCAWST